MINVLYLIDHIWNTNGGTEGQLMMLLENLDRRKFNPHLICLKETAWSRAARVNFPLRVLNINKLFTPTIAPKLLDFCRYCRENRIDILQTHFNDSLILGVIAGRLSGVKTIIAGRRNLGPGFWRRRNLLYAFRALRPLITRYIANSQATRDSISLHEGIPAERIDVIYNGLDLCRFASADDGLRARMRVELGLNDPHVLVGMVAHLRREKNIPLFIEAAARIAAVTPRARFILLGEGEERGNIEGRIRDMGLEDIFKLAGSIMDVVPYLTAMDIACLTSDGESFSNSIIEYQAAGLPVVATAAGGIPEAVSSKDFLFRPGDLAELVRLLSRLIEDESLRNDLGRAGRKLVHGRYSVEKMVESYENIYDRCLAS